jgi:hypothetical protein
MQTTLKLGPRREASTKLSKSAKQGVIRQRREEKKKKLQQL